MQRLCSCGHRVVTLGSCPRCRKQKERKRGSREQRCVSGEGAFVVSELLGELPGCFNQIREEVFPVMVREVCAFDEGNAERLYVSDVVQGKLAV